MNTDHWKDRFVFPSLIEGFQKGLGDRFTAETKSRLKESGLDVDKIPPAIPAKDVSRYLAIIGQGAWPDVSPEEQVRLLGLQMIRGWQTGLLGSAAAAMLRVIGPRRTLSRLNRAFSTTDNYSRATTDFVGSQEALITINEVHDMPSYWQGVFQGGIELLGLKGTVCIESEAPPSATFRLKWE